MTILETLIQFRRHWRAIDMLLEREINQMQEEKGKGPISIELVSMSPEEYDRYVATRKEPSHSNSK